MLTQYQFSIIVMMLIIWGLAGALFGALFAGLYQVLWVLKLPSWQILIAASAIAAMTTSAFYSTMPVALVGSMGGVLASISYLISTGLNVELLPIMGIAGITGVIAGSCYAWMVKNGGRPLAEMLTGLIAGLLASGSLTLISTILPLPVDILRLTTLTVALFGIFFQLSEPWLVKHSIGWLPAVFAAPFVAGLIATMVGASIWVMGETATVVLNMRTPSAFGHALDQVPAGLLGGLLGGAMTGLLLKLLGYHLEDIFETSVDRNKPH